MTQIALTSPAAVTILLERGKLFTATPGISSYVTVAIPAESVAATVSAAADFGPYLADREVTLNLFLGTVVYEVKDSAGGSAVSAASISSALDAATPAELAAIQSSVSWYGFPAGSFGRIPCNAAIIGNSLTAGGEMAGALSVNCPSVIVGTRAGIGGNTSAMVLARMDADIPTGTDACFYLEAVNDVTTNAGEATHVANVRQIMRKFKARGILPVMLLNGPLNGGQSATLSKYRTLDTLIAKEENIPAYDPFREFVDPVAGGWTSGAATDGTHPTQATYQAAGLALGTKIRDADVASLRPLYNNIAHSLQPTGNHLMLTDTNADGVANGWALLGTATGVTLSISSGASDGILGNWQNLSAVNVTGAKQLYAANITAAGAGYTAGQELVFCLTQKFTPGAGSPNMSSYVEVLGGAGAGRRYFMYVISEAFGVRRLQIRIRVPVGCTGMQVYAQVTAAGTYSAEMSIGEFVAYNISALLPTG